MRNWYLLLVFIFLITACSDDENKTQEFREIKIEKYYSYFYGVQALDEMDDTFKAFYNNIFSINSLTELNANPLYSQCTDAIKEELKKTNFEKYTLIVIGSFSFNKSQR